MVALPTFRRLSREDFKGAPEWLDPLIAWLNQFVEYVVLANNKGLTLAENIQCDAFRQVDIVAGATPDLCTAQFTTTLKVQPKGVLLVRVVQKTGNYVVIGAAVTIEWRFENGRVLITGVTGLTAGNTYTLTFLVV